MSMQSGNTVSVVICGIAHIKFLQKDLSKRVLLRFAKLNKND